MAYTFLEPGTDATQDTSLWSAVGGAPVHAKSDTANPRPDSGPNVLAINGTGNGYTRRDGCVADAGGRINFGLYIDVLGSGTRRILNLTNSGGSSNCLGINTTSAGKLQLCATDLQVGSDSSVTLSAATYYRITLAWTGMSSSSGNEARLWVDGVLAISVTSFVVVGLPMADIFLDGSNTTSTNFNRYTDISVDDSTALTDPGDLRVTAKRPAANSTNAWNTNLGANPANRWTNVNERPLSETNGWEHTALSAAEESYGIEAAAAGDVDLTGATIIGHGTWVWAKGGAGGLGSPQIIRNGTDVAVTLTASPAYYAAYATSGTYPSGVIGMKSAGVLDTTFLYETGMLIVYTPAAAGGANPPYTPRRQLDPVLIAQ